MSTCLYIGVMQQVGRNRRQPDASFNIRRTTLRYCALLNYTLPSSYLIVPMPVGHAPRHHLREWSGHVRRGHRHAAVDPRQPIAAECNRVNGDTQHTVICSHFTTTRFSSPLRTLSINSRKARVPPHIIWQCTLAKLCNILCHKNVDSNLQKIFQHPCLVLLESTFCGLHHHHKPPQNHNNH